MNIADEILSFISDVEEAVIIENRQQNVSKIHYVNRAIERFIGHPLAEDQFDSFSLLENVYPDDKEAFSAYQKKIVETGQKQLIVVRIQNQKTKDFLWVEVQGLVKRADKQGQHIYYSIRDIDIQIQSETLLKQSEQKHRLLFARANDAIFIIKNLKIVECNEKTLSMFESPGYSSVSGKKMHCFMPEIQLDGQDSVLSFHYLLQNAIEGKPQFFYWVFAKFNGVHFDAEVSLSALKLGDEDFVQVIVRDTTARKKAEQEKLRAELAEKNNKILQKEIEERVKAEEELKSAQQYASSIINSSLDVIVACDKDGYITEYNKAAEKVYGYSSDEILGKEIWTLLHQKDDAKRLVDRIISDGFFLGEVASQTKNGELFISYASASKLINNKGETVGTVSVIKDITELKASEKKLRESIAQKEVLLREVHHRVKNNLQVINSILKLQSMHLEDEKTIMALHDCQERIKSMAFIHESLYQSNDLAKVNFSEYLRNLSNNLLFSYQVNANKIKLLFEVEPVSLSLDTGISCGLIVNELISNALKYAFKDQENGQIKLTLSKEKNGHLFILEDNGSGIPDNVNYKKTNSLGFQLVLGLVDQIDGTIQLKKDKGTKFIIKFKRR